MWKPLLPACALVIFSAGVSGLATNVQPKPGEPNQRKPIDGPASEELRSIAKADQADRQFSKPPTPEEWKPIAERDRQRKARVLALLNQNRLVSAGDYDNAALVFQHGELPDDFLAAHEL